MPICKEYEKEYKPLTAIRCKIEVSNEENKIHQTNADRIRSMSDEELASFLANFEQQDIGNEWCLKLCPKREAKSASGVDCDCPYGNYETALAWLKSEVEECRGLWRSRKQM